MSGAPKEGGNDRARYSQASLAAYLRGLGFESFVLPGGFPAEAAGPSRSRESSGSAASSDAGMTTGSERTVVRPRRSSPQSPCRAPVSSEQEPRTAPAEFDIAASLAPAARLTKLTEVKNHSASCTACVLSRKRNTVVFGSGSAEADLMLIGEGPGAQEDLQGEPFVGPAGELLTKMLAAIDFAREDIYIANVVKCRPPGNRDPKPEEVVACSGYLRAQVNLVKPRVILALGRVAAQALLASTQPLGRMRSQWHEAYGVPVWVTYHPAALLRNSSYKRPAWEDLQFIRDHLNGPTESSESD